LFIEADSIASCSVLDSGAELAIRQGPTKGHVQSRGVSRVILGC
jgi:hypothetical protein